MARVRLLVEVNTDPVPGSFHTPESVVEQMNAMLKDFIPWYKPTVVLAPDPCGQDHPLDFCSTKPSTGETLFCSKHYATLFEEE